MKGGKFRNTNVIYKAKIVTYNNINTYIGLSSNEIKKRIASHYTTINFKLNNKSYSQYTQATEWSKLVHNLERGNLNFKLNWKVVTSKPKAKYGVESCRLCLKETLLILESNDNCKNRRTELMNTYTRKLLFKNWKKAVT